MKQKDNSYANSYLKVSAIDGKEGIIMASDVAGYDNEPHMSLPLFQQANENCSSINKEYNTVLADSNFTSAENCVAFENADAQLIGPTRNFQEQERLRAQGTDVISFSYDENNKCVKCSMGAVLQEKSRCFDEQKNTTLLSFSNPAACKTCIRRNECTSSKAEYRRVRLDIRGPAQNRTLQLYRSAEGQRLYNRRSHVAETPQGDLKHNGRFIQLFRRSLRKTRVDYMYHDIVWNLRRIFNTKGNALAWVN
jgi:hypothetical protein